MHIIKPPPKPLAQRIRSASIIAVAIATAITATVQTCTTCREYITGGNTACANVQNSATNPATPTTATATKHTPTTTNRPQDSNEEVSAYDTDLIPCHATSQSAHTAQNDSAKPANGHSYSLRPRQSHRSHYQYPAGNVPAASGTANVVSP